MAKDKNRVEDTEQESFSMRDYFAACVSKWQWFLLSIIVICSLAMLYVMRQQPQYLRTEQVLIKDEKSGGSTDAISNMFSSMGLGTMKTNVYNELITLQSPALMAQVVQRLDLCNSYLLKKLPHGQTLYGSSLPFRVVFEDLTEFQSGTFVIKVNPDGSAKLDKFVLYGADGATKFKDEISVRPGFTTVKTPLGKLTFVPNPSYTASVDGKKETKAKTYAITRMALQPTISAYNSKVKADLADKDADVIELSIKDVNVQRAEDILNTIIEVYNQDWIKDKNKMAIATSEFIDERLRSLEGELGDVDSDISEFKSRTLIPDVEEAAKLNMRNTTEINTSILQTNNELGMAKYLQEYVNNPANHASVIPVNTGIGSPQLENQIANYNNMLLMRNNLVAATSVNNPLVKDYDSQLEGLRDAVQRGINTYVASLERAVRNMEGAKGNINSNLASGPKQAKYLLNVERQQKVKSELYLYLLQKREENELSMKFTAENTRIIMPPYGPLSPVEPKRNMVLAIAFVIAVLIPAGLIYIQEASNTKVRSRKDLEKMAVPFAGEIPFVGKKKRFEWLRKKLESKSKTKKKLETVPVTVQAGCRDVVNESFRIVRSNIEFMFKDKGDSKVTMITSFNPGSGKSFVTFNLGASFAIKGKKVLIIDCDLRHGSSSQYVGWPSQGLSNYLTGHTDDWKRLVVDLPDTPGLSVLPIGHRPPNPAELLDNGRMATLLGEMKGEYDYILLDCPPIDVVVDTQVMVKYADQTIFVVRAGLLDRSAIREIDEMYDSHRFQRMCLLLNGTEKEMSRYGTYGSSYYSSDFS